jgi:putative hydrolase of the HAD superfamily
MIKWIIFDAMGVVFTESDDVHNLLIPFVQKRNPISKEDIYDIYRQASIGQISSREFWKYVGLGYKYPQIETTYLDSRSDIDAGFVSVARSLSKKYGIGLLSNDISEWSAYLRNKFSIDFFDVVVISSDVYCRKPDPPIFAHFLKDAKTHTEECIFIDDRIRNLITAQSIGMKTIHFARRDEKSDFIPDGSITSFEQLEYIIEKIRQQTI